MATSYYIYIKGEGGNGTDGANKPNPHFTPKPQVIDEENDDISSYALSALAKVGANIKGLGILGAAVVIGKIALKTTEAVSSYMTRETGDETFSRNFQTAQGIFRMLSNPVGTATTIINMEQTNRLTNQRIREQRVLLGDSRLTEVMRKV
jgi:hypothetical protein